MEAENLSYSEVDDLRHPAINALGERNYRLFAALADVRNRGDGIEPLFPRRGLPDDVSAGTKKHMDDNGEDYHSHTHFTLAELMEVDPNKLCTRMAVSFFPEQYMSWKETGTLPDDVYEEWEIKNLTNDPIHREVTEEEMLLLLLTSGDLKKLTKKCQRLFGGKREKKVIGGPYVTSYVPVSYARVVPHLFEIIPELQKMGSPDAVRVVIAFDN